MSKINICWVVAICLKSENQNKSSVSVCFCIYSSFLLKAECSKMKIEFSSKPRIIGISFTETSMITLKGDFYS